METAMNYLPHDVSEGMGSSTGAPSELFEGS